MARLTNSGLTSYRSPQEPLTQGDVVRIENKNGDIMVFTPKEAKEALKQYITDELELFADDVVKRHNIVLSEKIVRKLVEVERKLTLHINDKIDKLTESIMEKIISRVIKEEVDKQLEIKLDNIRKLL